MRKAQSVDCWGTHGPNILIVCPPPIHPEMADPAMGKGCDVKTHELPAYYAATAKLTGCHFMDAAECEFNQLDHMHLTRKGHARLAELLAELVPTLIP